MKKHHSQVSTILLQDGEGIYRKGFPFSNIKNAYSCVTKSLFKAIFFLLSHFPPTDVLSGKALRISLVDEVHNTPH